MWHKILKKSKRHWEIFQIFSLACDETKDISRPAHLTIFVCGDRVTAESDTKEVFLSLQAMHAFPYSAKE